jgi:hypothetical protein
MITFRQHIEINKWINKEKNISGYLESLKPHKRIEVMRDVSDVYPINNLNEIKEETLNSFKCHSKINHLILGQFIMIEQIITGKVNYESSAHNDLELAKLIMRPNHHEIFDNENIEDEEFNEKKILDTDVRQVYAVLQKFLDDREFVLFKQFKGVFYEVNEDEEYDEEVVEKTGEALFQQQWYWYSMVRLLAKEDITKYEDIYMLNMSVVMPEMSYLAQKNKIESARQRQSQAMSKL